MFLALVTRQEAIVVWTDYLGWRITIAKMPWRDLPCWMRIVHVLMIAGSCVLMGSLLTVGQIENSAIWQPSSPEGTYLYPHKIKGSIRYFSGGQERVYRIAEPLMTGGFAVMLPMSGIFVIILERLNKRRRQAALEDLVKRLEERNWMG
jgi:hypothetical protein